MLGWPQVESAITGFGASPRRAQHDHPHSAPPRTDQPEAATPWQRFEHAALNDLWQMDFKGHIHTSEGICHPLTVLDDHSRFSLGIRACPEQRYRTVQAHLTDIFARYVPVRINTDNGSPWGSSREPGQLTERAIWLMCPVCALTFATRFAAASKGGNEIQIRAVPSMTPLT